MHASLNRGIRYYSLFRRFQRVACLKVGMLQAMLDILYQIFQRHDVGSKRQLLFYRSVFLLFLQFVQPGLEGSKTIRCCIVGPISIRLIRLVGLLLPARCICQQNPFTASERGLRIRYFLLIDTLCFAHIVHLPINVSGNGAHGMYPELVAINGIGLFQDVLRFFRNIFSASYGGPYLRPCFSGLRGGYLSGSLANAAIQAFADILQRIALGCSISFSGT